jgi:hypothetical protein
VRSAFFLFGHPFFEGDHVSGGANFAYDCDDGPWEKWSWLWDSNPQPADYKSAALPIELNQPEQVKERTDHLGDVEEPSQRVSS